MKENQTETEKNSVEEVGSDANCSTSETIKSSDLIIWNKIDSVECGETVEGRAIVSFHQGEKIMTVMLDRRYIDFLIKRMSKI